MEWNAYHFVGDTLRDGRPIPANGELLKHTGPLEMCAAGLHASRTAWQALNYARGPTLCRVHCGGDVIEPSNEDKIVCSERTIISRIDATALLWEFARSCARDVLHLWDAPDVVRQYLATGDEDLRDAARYAARAAQAAARDAAWEARDAARAAREAAWAARYAARDAAREAWYAARDARDAAWEAWYAAPDARGAAIQKQRARFTCMVNSAFDTEPTQ